MKIAFLISTVHDLGGTAGAIVTQANALCEAARGGDHQRLPAKRATTSRSTRGSTVTDLVDLRGDKVVVPGLDPDRAAALQGRQPTMIEAGSDPTLDALADVALEAALPDLDADVLVTVTPGPSASPPSSRPPAPRSCTRSTGPPASGPTADGCCSTTPDGPTWS